MPRTQPLGNFEVLGFRRHGFEATRTPADPGGLALGGLRPTLTLTTETGPQPVARLPFVEGFENGDKGGWGSSVGVTFTQAEHYQGSWSSTITAVQGVGSDKYLEYNFGDHPTVAGVAVGQRDLYLKFAHKWGANWQDGTYNGLQKLALLNIHNNVSGARRFQLTFNMSTTGQSNFFYFCEFLRWQEAGGSNGVTTGNIALNFVRVLDVWQEFVFRVRMNTPGQLDGILQIWTKTEGDTAYVLRVDRSNINYRDSTTFSPNRLIQSNYQPETVLSGTRYWDGWLLTEDEIDVSPDVQTPKDFPTHTPGYLSCYPGVGGAGMDTHGGMDLPTVVFINSLSNENSGTAINASMSLALNWPTPSFIGTPEYAARHAASPKWIDPIICGVATIQKTIPNQTGTPPRPGLTTYAGQTAPAPGLILRGCNWSLNGGSGMVIWHMIVDVGDDATGNAAGNRDCISSGYAGGTTTNIVLIKCNFTRSVDELADFFRGHNLVTMVECAFYEPLHASTIIHPEDGPGVDHGFGPIFGGDSGTQTGFVTTFRCLWAHTTGRNPLINATEFTHANNLHYNHGRPAGGAGNGVQLYSSVEPTFSNVLGNLFVRGPNNNTSMVSISVATSMPPGSQGYSFANAQFGWTSPSTQNSFFTSAPAGFVVGGLIDVAYPNSWGVGLSGILQWAANPLAPSLSEVNTFVDKIERNVGAMARWRTPQNSRLPLVFNQIRDRLAGVAQTNQFVDTCAQSGGYPTITPIVLNPLADNAPHWHAPLPRGPLIHTPYTSGFFSDGLPRAGYTPWFEWHYEQNLYVSQYDQTPPNPPTNVNVSSLSTTTLRVIWSGATDDEDGSGIAFYRVFRSTTSGGTYAQVGADLPASTTQYDDSSLGSSTTRWYRIYSIDAAGNVSLPSVAASGTTQSDIPTTSWADMFTDSAGIQNGISVDGRTVGIRGTSLAAWGPRQTPGNGGQLIYRPAMSFDGLEPVIEFRPPTTLVGTNSQYNTILDGLLWRNGLNNIKQVNFRWLEWIGPRYWDLSATLAPKWVGFKASTSRTEEINPNRMSVFDQPQSGTVYFSVTSTTFQAYNFPTTENTAASKLIAIRGTNNHALNAPQTGGGEWLCFEMVCDVMQNRGNPFGRNELRVWTRDRAANGRFLRIPLNYDPAWNFARQYIYIFEGLGSYFNGFATAHADNYKLWSHCTMAANMGIDELMGPPPGF
jgi:hypothetical protein